MPGDEGLPVNDRLRLEAVHLIADGKADEAQELLAAAEKIEAAAKQNAPRQRP